VRLYFTVPESRNHTTLNTLTAVDLFQFRRCDDEFASTAP